MINRLLKNRGEYFRTKTSGIVLVVLSAAVAAWYIADAEGLRKGRIHLENMWGNAAMQYEPDGALILNKDLSKDGTDMVRIAIEKSRRGKSEIEWRYPFYGSAYRFGTNGELVKEEESWQRERSSLQTGGRP